MTVSMLPSGIVLGHYRLGGRIGRGGMGEVYEAFDLVLERRVALKILNPELIDHPDRVRRFVQEAKSASALNHPHILTVHEIGEDVIDGRPAQFIAMELVEGTTLREEIHLRRTPLRRLLLLLAQTADALAKAHAGGIIHRDLKPDNVMVTADGYAKVIDFGIAKLAEPRVVAEQGSDTVSLTREGNLLGTVGYMSPEQIEQKPVDHRSDIFAFGCILYEAATRSRAFQAESDVEVLYKILREPPPPIPLAEESVPLEVRRMIERCLEKRPQDRYQSMRDVALELRSIDPLLSGEPQRFGMQRRARRRTALAIALALMILTSIVAMVVLSRRTQRPVATPVMRALVRWPSDEEDCRISPDGAWVSFLSNRTGKVAIWIRQMRGGEPRILIQAGDDIRAHVWSPRGDQIAYLSVADGKAFLQLVPAFGGPPTSSIALEARFQDGRLIRWIGSNIYAELPDGLWRLDTASLRASRIAGSSAAEGRRVRFDVRSDEQKITYSVHRGDFETLWIANLDGRDPVLLTDSKSAYSDYRSRFASKDELIFSSDRSGQIDLWRLPLATRQAHQITFSPTVEWVDDISTDGRTIALEEDRRGSNLWLWNGSGSVQLTQDNGRDRSPTAARSSVVLQRSKPTISVRSFDSDLYVGELSKSGLGELRQIVTDAGWPLLDPTGQRLAYVKQTQPTQQQLWVKDLQSQHQWLLTNHLKPIMTYKFPRDRAQSNPVWAADGGSIYFVERDANRQVIQRFSFPSMTSNLVTATQRDVDLSDPRLSVDGRRLAYIRRSAGLPLLWEVVLRDLSSGKEATIWSRTHGLGLRVFCAGWDANDALMILVGTVLADSSEHLDAIRIDGLGKQTITPLVERGFGGTARLNASSGFMILTTVDSQGFHNLTRVSLAAGDAQHLTQNQLPGVTFAGIEFLDHPQVLFCRQESNSDLWLIDITPDR
jgi:serine/threonine protein kinase/Tol biopolymer transport system component